MVHLIAEVLHQTSEPGRVQFSARFVPADLSPVDAAYAEVFDFEELLDALF